MNRMNVIDWGNAGGSRRPSAGVARTGLDALGGLSGEREQTTRRNATVPHQLAEQRRQLAGQRHQHLQQPSGAPGRALQDLLQRLDPRHLPLPLRQGARPLQESQFSHPT